MPLKWESCKMGFVLCGGGLVAKAQRTQSRRKGEVMEDGIL